MTDTSAVFTFSRDSRWNILNRSLVRNLLTIFSPIGTFFLSKRVVCSHNTFK
ncbi:unnamed protein product [Ixodes persulcatus]